MFEPTVAALGSTVREVAVSSTSWGGKMVTAGVVRATATINGRTRGASAAVDVTRRTAWDALVVIDCGTDVSPRPITPTPVVSEQLGNTSFLARTDRSAAGFVGDDGPNEGLSYFTKLPFWLQVEYGHNSVALSPNSAFYLNQFNTRQVIDGTVYCGKADVIPGMRDLVYAHEGTSRAAPGSHYQTYVAEFERLSRPEGESVVWRDTGPLVTLRNRWSPLAEAESNRLTHAPANLDRLQNQLGCTITLFASSGG